MANEKYALPDYVTARVRYYNGQFLRDDDFIDEQRYHIVEGRRHERLLHVAGITEGLDVVAVGSSSVKIAAGSAIDEKGRSIRLEQDVTIPVSGSDALYVEIGFSETETNPSDQNSSVQSYTRFTQNGRPTLSTARTAWTVLLAELSLASSTIKAVKLDNRVYSGLRLPGSAGAGGYLRSRGDAFASWAEVGCSLSVKGDMLASGNVSVNGGLSFGSTKRQMLSLFGGTHGVGVQTSTLYFRTDKNIAFYKGGTHDDGELNAGNNGAVQLAINNGNVGVATSSPQAKLHVVGVGTNSASIVGGTGNTTTNYNATGWTFTNALEARAGEKDSAPGIVFHQQNVLTFGLVAQNSPRGLRVTGPTNEVAPGLFVDGDASVGGGLSFGEKQRQMLNLWKTSYGIGVQAVTTYFRSDQNFAFYKGGKHADGSLDAGTNGTVQLVINDGNVGIGTTAPKGPLHVTGNVALGSDANNQRFVIHSRTSNGGDFLQITSDDANGAWAWGKGLTLLRSGNVGIGTTSPQSDLTIRKDASGALGPVLTLQNSGGNPGAGGAIDFNGYDVGQNAPSSRIQSLDDGTYSSSLVFLTKTPGKADNALKERMRIASDGTVSIGAGRVAACKEETLRIIRGVVKSDGGVYAGSGFSVSKQGTGLYDVSFTTGFATDTIPAVVVTQMYEGSDVKGGSTLDNATLVQITRAKFRVKTGKSSGDADDRWFSFMVLGV